MKKQWLENLIIKNWPQYKNWSKLRKLVFRFVVSKQERVKKLYNHQDV